MPLRDHFRPPLDDLRHWEGFHATWPVMIVAQLRRKLPRRYFAEPRIHSGSSAEIDVATFEDEGEGDGTVGDGHNNGGGVATAVWTTNTCSRLNQGNGAELAARQGQLTSLPSCRSS